MLATHAVMDRDRSESAAEEDNGVIRCICGSTEDDGFTIQCEKCLVWQHAACFEIDHDSVPENYLCELCLPRTIDTKRLLEGQRRKENGRKRLSPTSGPSERGLKTDGLDRRRRNGARRKQRSQSTKDMFAFTAVHESVNRLVVVSDRVYDLCREALKQSQSPETMANKPEFAQVIGGGVWSARDEPGGTEPAASQDSARAGDT